VDKVDPKRSSH